MYVINVPRNIVEATFIWLLPTSSSASNLLLILYRDVAVPGNEALDS